MTDRHATERHFLRLCRSQRAQHIVLIVSFTLLVITGLPVRYHEAKASEIIVRSIGGMAARGIIHRVAALMLIGVCIYHVLWSLFTERGHRELMAMIPGKKDAFDLIGQLKLYFGLSKTGPKYDRFTWIEKFEYLAMGWGSAVMITTGFLLWFQSQAMLIMPKWMLDVAQVIHSYEALLAFLAIIIWHFYHVHLNPQSFPMSRVWLSGLISEEELKEGHALEYERLIASGKLSAPEAKDEPPSVEP